MPSNEVQQLLDHLEKKDQLVAMLAPSFVIDFKYSEIVGQLRRLGFFKIIEIAFGALETNRQLLSLVKENPEKRYITNPCPTMVRLIKSKYPDLEKYLTPIDSPMSASARAVLEKYPNARPVFIGPCVAKKLEAQQDWPKLNILVLTYKEILETFETRGVGRHPNDLKDKFDIPAPTTRLYPISGGLAQSAGVNDLMVDEEYDVISGPKLVEKSLKDFRDNSKMKLLDILYCEGGCVSGIGINSDLPLEKRRQKVVEFWSKT